MHNQFRQVLLIDCKPIMIPMHKYERSGGMQNVRAYSTNLHVCQEDKIWSGMFLLYSVNVLM